MSKEQDTNPRRALGRGLSALLPQRQAAEGPAGGTEAAIAREAALPENFEDFQSIPLNQIQPGEQQPRGKFDAVKLAELANSIRANGVIQPITVYQESPGKYRIIAGERRWKAAELAGLTAIPALVRSAAESRRLEMALIENLQREDLNAIEIAQAFQRLATEHGLSHEQIAERTGKDRSTVTNFIRLLRASPIIRLELLNGNITMGHARAILNLPESLDQAKLCGEIMQFGWSVRKTEQMVRAKILAKGRELRAPKPEKKVDPNVRAALEEMAATLGTKVNLVAKSAKSGRIEIEYYSQEDLDRIYSVIVKQ